MTTDYYQRIFEAIVGYTPERPQNLVGILGFVDGREKLVLTHDELSGALKRLMAAGRVGEPSAWVGRTPRSTRARPAR
jgi:hypothetical protein